MAVRWFGLLGGLMLGASSDQVALQGIDLSLKCCDVADEHREDDVRNRGQ